MEGGPSTTDDWDCDLFKKSQNRFSKPIPQDMQHTFSFCGAVSLQLTASPWLRRIVVSQVLGEERSTIAWPCLVLC